MKSSPTMHIGPLGSTVHVLRADAGTVAALAAIDWNRYFPRVCLDPVRGLITLMSPSHLHEDLSEIFGHIVDVAGSELAGAAKGIRSTRLRGQGEPPGTGMEPDCAFYVGERAREFRDALVGSREEAAAFIERIAPDLVVEVEITNADAGKVERYAEMGVRELWRLHGRRGSDELRADFLALRPGREPRALDASGLLEGLTPEDVCAAVEGVRLSLTPTERTEAIARIVRRRRRESVRVREEDAPPYAVDSKAPREHEARASS
ncbi:MAG: Uma2 family endonuclease [Chromatiales bacterium]|nr:Uma2 family endonuclease [Chromatiales bacterium]